MHDLVAVGLGQGLRPLAQVIPGPHVGGGGRRDSGFLKEVDVEIAVERAPVVGHAVELAVIGPFSQRRVIKVAQVKPVAFDQVVDRVNDVAVQHDRRVVGVEGNDVVRVVANQTGEDLAEKVRTDVVVLDGDATAVRREPGIHECLRALKFVRSPPGWNGHHLRALGKSRSYAQTAHRQSGSSQTGGLQKIPA